MSSPRDPVTEVFSDPVRPQDTPPVLPPQPVLAEQPQGAAQLSVLPPDTLTNDPNLWRTYDPDVWRENPVETKHRKLLRSQRLGDEGRDLKPGPVDRDRLAVSLSLCLTGVRSDGLRLFRRFSVCLRQPLFQLSTRTFSGSSGSPYPARPSHSQSSSSASPGPILWRRSKQSRSFYLSGAKKSGWTMR